jgi:hypothetical protein
MPATRPALHTGGCQCGAVRYALHADPDGASICHCRMCQKATGGLFGAYAGVTRANLTFTRGKPASFRSSELIERDFCRDCGTPLTFRYLDRDRVSLSIGSLDDPSRVPPRMQFGIESRLPCFSGLASLPAQTTEQSIAPERLARLASRQHPDHDTAEWPLRR